MAACRRLGYQHPDLTMHPAQVRDWYAGEDGLDLRALDSDHGVLAAAASAAEDAARMQADLVAELDRGMVGPGRDGRPRIRLAQLPIGDRRQRGGARGGGRGGGTAGRAVAGGRREGARPPRPSTARQQPQRAEWLAAAKTVTTGAGDVAAASELIDLQVKPFVDRDVGSDWLAAMRDGRLVDRRRLRRGDRARRPRLSRCSACPATSVPAPSRGLPPKQSGGGEAGARAEPSPVRTAPAAFVPSAAAPAPAAASVATGADAAVVAARRRCAVGARVRAARTVRRCAVDVIDAVVGGPRRRHVVARAPVSRGSDSSWPISSVA